jgi:hypothetical protein
VRRNLHHVLYVVDVSSTDQVKYVDHIFNLIQREVPFRFGLIPAYCSNDKTDQGLFMGSKGGFVKDRLSLVFTFIASLASKAAYYIFRNSKLGTLKAFIEQLISISLSTTAKTFSKEDISSVFFNIMKTSLDNVVGEEWDVLLENLKDFSTRVGIDCAQGALFFNGKFIEINQVCSKHN